MDFFSFDAEYVERLAAGDAAVVQHFNDYFRELIFIKLRSRQYGPQAIDDIRQETFLRVLQALQREGVRQPERLGAFVNAVCNNVVLEFHRAGSRMTFMDETPDRADAAADSERALLERERRQLMRRLLERMSEKNQKLLTAVFLDERPLDEVCAELKVDRGYLRVLLFRARNELKQALEKNSRGRSAGGAS